VQIYKIHAKAVKYISICLIRIKEFGYVNDIYATADATLIKKEIYLHGPVPASMMSDMLGMYSSGVFTCSEVDSSMFSLEQLKIIKSLNDGFEPVTHSVLIVGWGVEDGDDFWWV